MDDEAAIELRMALVEIGLLERSQAATAGALRYGLHPVVAAFADAHLAEAPDEARAIGLAHAAHYAAIVAGYDDAI